MKNLLIFVGLISIVLCVIGVKYSLERKEYCGTVKYKIDKAVLDKINGNLKPVMIVDFKEVGVIELHPNWNNYLSHDIGDEYCAIISTPNSNKTIWKMLIIIGLLSFTFSFAILMVMRR